MIPCVTAHYFYEALQAEINIPILHIVEETAAYCRAHFKSVREIGLIATSGTLHTGLFQKAFGKGRIELLLPTPETQKKWVMEAIYGKEGIKAVGPSENSRRFIREASLSLIDRGARAVIAGCTEISLVLKDGELPVPVIDPVSILAEAAVKRARAKK